MKKIFLFLILSIQYGNSAQACRFEGLSLTSIQKNKEFRTENQGPVHFPRELIRSQVSALGEVNAKECLKGFWALKIVDLKNGETYTAFHSNWDECDGGNSFGVIVKGTQALPDQGVATIEDSDFWCF